MPSHSSLRSSAAALLLGSLVFPTIGCSDGGPTASLLPEQAAAVKALEALNAVVTIQDGEAVYVDFYQTRDMATATPHLEALPRVEKLNFSSTNLTDNDLAHVAHLAELQELALLNTAVTDEGLVHVAGLSKLQSLNLDENEISDAGLAHLSGLTELKRLHLNRTRITDEGLEHLAGLTKLEWLLVYGSQATDRGAQELREKLPHVEITTSPDSEVE